MLLDIVTSSADSLDSLNTRDLKLAFGEEVEEEIVEEAVDEEIDSEELVSEDEPVIEDLQEEEPKEENSGVEALKNLLTALTDKNVAASMKGMKISINITLGDN